MGAWRNDRGVELNLDAFERSKRRRGQHGQDVAGWQGHQGEVDDGLAPELELHLVDPYDAGRRGSGDPVEGRQRGLLAQHGVCDVHSVCFVDCLWVGRASDGVETHQGRGGAAPGAIVELKRGGNDARLANRESHFSANDGGARQRCHGRTVEPTGGGRDAHGTGGPKSTVGGNSDVSTPPVAIVAVVAEPQHEGAHAAQEPRPRRVGDGRNEGRGGKLLGVDGAGHNILSGLERPGHVRSLRGDEVRDDQISVNGSRFVVGNDNIVGECISKRGDGEVNGLLDAHHGADLEWDRAAKGRRMLTGRELYSVVHPGVGLVADDHRVGVAQQSSVRCECLSCRDCCWKQCV